MHKDSIIFRLYNEDANYKITNNSSIKTCCVFCSSNGLFSSNNDFKSIDINRFEWTNISQNKRMIDAFGKYIFLRDVFEKSYVDGLNKHINTIDSIIELVKKETVGYEVVCVGSSGGGYLAIILGAKLPNCSRVYSFGGLLSLYTWTGAHDNFSFNDITAYQRHIGDNDYSKYYSLKSLLINYHANLFHFYGLNHKSDCVQLKELIGIQNDNIRTIGIITNKHGGDFYGFSYPYLLTRPDRLLNFTKKGNRTIGKNNISIKVIGLVPFVFQLLNRIFFKNL